MGLRRLRGRLDQVQGEANATMQMAQELLANIQDGVGIKIIVDAARLRPLLKELLMGNSVDSLELPFTIKVDPTIDKD